MSITQILSTNNLTEVIQVLNKSHSTVAKKFGFTKEENPTNAAFIKEDTLKLELEKGIELFALSVESKYVGCIAIEKSKKEEDTFYIEKVSVVPEKRNNGYGVQLMNFATDKIRQYGGKNISIALIDSHTDLKNWYLARGFTITGTKDFKHLPFRVCFMAKDV